VLEEGYSIEDLRRICKTMAKTAREAGVQIVTGDTKVVGRGAGDGVYINTSGIGVLKPGVGPEGKGLSGTYCKPGDKIIVSGTLGDHGIAIISTREQLSFSAPIYSDAAPLNHLIQDVLDAAPGVRCFRDPTRGGLASTLNELAEQSATTMEVQEDAVPVHDAVRGACDMLGYDVFQVANEGKMVCVVAPEDADAAIGAMRACEYGADAAIIGVVTGEAGLQDDGKGAKNKPHVFVRTAFGSTRIMDTLVGEQLPRIC
jgi:hydrogenase expression/formation protein HypE